MAERMKVLEGLEKLKYTALHMAYMYGISHNMEYRSALDSIIQKTLDDYGKDGLAELLNFINLELE